MTCDYHLGHFLCKHSGFQLHESTVSRHHLGMDVDHHQGADTHPGHGAFVLEVVLGADKYHGADAVDLKPLTASQLFNKLFISMSVSGHFHAKSGRKIHVLHILYTCNYVLYTKYEYQIILIYIWANPQKQLPTWQETFPQPIHFLTDQTDFGCFSGTPVGGARGVLDPMIPWTRISDVLGCRWLYMATNGLTIASRWSSCLSVVSFVAACCYGSRNAIQHEFIWTNIHGLE